MGGRIILIVEIDKKFTQEEGKKMDKDLRICILNRGWVMVGEFSKQGTDCTLQKASVIRKWGTTKGLGELAKDGPTKETILEPCNGEVNFDWNTTVATIKCNPDNWR